MFRQPTRGAVEVRCPGVVVAGEAVELDAKQRLALADLARAAIREHDPYVQVIDVNVVQVSTSSEPREPS
ncbi:MAG: hypothetical protein HZB15_03685 [Actinobacteria bacterium]|nr:hypothetical protein [Actinomycetota bacterium]